MGLEVADDFATQHAGERHLVRRVRRDHVGQEAAEGGSPLARRHVGEVLPEESAGGRVGQQASSIEVRDDDAVGEAVDHVPKQDGRGSRPALRAWLTGTAFPRWVPGRRSVVPAPSILSVPVPA
jgi:hypothetical protein